jgi:hypothetical protein
MRAGFVAARRNSFGARSEPLETWNRPIRRAANVKEGGAHNLRYVN